MKRFFCAAFFVAVVALLAACGALNVNSAAAQATATPTSSTSRTQKSDSTVKVNETAAKVDVVTAQSSASPTATAAPAQVGIDRPALAAMLPAFEGRFLLMDASDHTVL